MPITAVTHLNQSRGRCAAGCGREFHLNSLQTITFTGPTGSDVTGLACDECRDRLKKEGLLR